MSEDIHVVGVGKINYHWEGVCLEKHYKEQVASIEREKAALEKERDCWIYNAQELQKQVNGWEPERQKLLAQLESSQCAFKILKKCSDELESKSQTTH